MNGAEALIATLADCGLTACFANPGTSEMHFVAALDRKPQMRCVLGLFEGVVSGAADGYYRIARRPAATLLHLGPGFANAMANLHNAGKGHAGIVNIVGEHATYHRRYASPLASRIEDSVGAMSDHVLLPDSPAALARDAAQAVALASGPRGAIASLILPADLSWLPGAPAQAIAPPVPSAVSSTA